MQTIGAGGRTFQMENRTFGGDGGPALPVFGDTDGKRVPIPEAGRHTEFAEHRSSG